MTYGTIRTDVSSFLGLTLSGNSRVTTAQVNEWINQAYRVAQSKMAQANINYYQGEIQDRDITVNIGRYPLPTRSGRSTFLAMKRLEIQYDDDTDKERATPIDINELWETVSPENDEWSQEYPYYAIWEDDFYIKPVPDESSLSWTVDSGSAMRLWFIEYQPDLSADADIPALPDAYHHILAYPATANGFRRLRKFAEAREYDDPKTNRGLWQVELAAMVAENQTHDKVKPLAFTMTRGPDTKHGIWRP